MDTEQKKELGKRIKELREKYGLYQSDLAERIGQDRSTVSTYERGRTVPPGEVLSQIADVLYTSTDYLLGKTDNPDPVGPELPEIPIEELNKYQLVYKGHRLSDEEAHDVIELLEAALKRWKK